MKESDIRPQGLMKKYIELSAKDAESYFNKRDRVDIPCVACGSENVTKEFSKSGFSYSVCRECETLYQSPRPTIKEFESFYRDSESSRYWSEVFFPSVAEIRREKIFRPRVDALQKICINNNFNVNKLIDVGAGYGIFLEEWKSSNPETSVLAIEPSYALAEKCREKNIKVIESIAENVTGYDNYADLVVCFEVLEHVYNPLEFILALKKMVRPGGYLFISTLSIDGFDMQTLWKESPQISPPHHINFHSIKGFELLFNKAELHDIQITTPGLLDVDIVKNFILKYPGLIKSDKFIQSILKSKKKSQHFQEFLSENKLSSHAWVIGRK